MKKNKYSFQKAILGFFYLLLIVILSPFFAVIFFFEWLYDYLNKIYYELKDFKWEFE